MKCQTGPFEIIILNFKGLFLVILKEVLSASLLYCHTHVVVLKDPVSLRTNTLKLSQAGFA